MRVFLLKAISRLFGGPARTVRYERARSVFVYSMY